MKNAKNSRNEIKEKTGFLSISDKQRHKISLISYVVPSNFLVIKPFQDQVFGFVFYMRYISIYFSLSWKRGDNVLELVADWVKSDLEAREKRLKKKASPAKGKNKVRFQETSEPVDIEFGFRVIRYLLRHPINRATMMRKHMEHVIDLLTALKGYMDLAGLAINYFYSVYF